MTITARSVDAERLGIVTTTLCLHCWDNKHLDRELLTRLDDCLIVLQASAFIGRYEREDVTLRRATRSSDISSATLDAITTRLSSDATRGKQPFHYQLQGLHVVGTIITEPVSNERSRRRGSAADAIVGYSALCFEDKFVPSGVDREKMVTFHGHCTTALLWQVLQHRVRVFLPVAPRVAERYWDDAGKNRYADTLTPPWESRGKDMLRTVTLGFDLRKSTFCMENADDPREFAYWLDDMVLILMRVAHVYGGVFDKFTGDGALVHFPVETTEKVYGKKAVTSAVYCAIDMQKAMAYHLARLRPLLRLDSKVVGGAIGIDVAPTHWTLDERDNPITVGRGVVNACRLMDSTKSGCVRLTNIAYYALDDAPLKRLFAQVPFISKEFGSELEIVAWELQNAADTVSLPLIVETDVAKICEHVWARR